jgi:hypothetical protein
VRPIAFSVGNAGEDIKDLTVLQQTPAPPVANDPAIISATQASGISGLRALRGVRDL